MLTGVLVFVLLVVALLAIPLSLTSYEQHCRTVQPRPSRTIRRWIPASLQVALNSSTIHRQVRALGALGVAKHVGSRDVQAQSRSEMLEVDF